MCERNIKKNKTIDWHSVFGTTSRSRFYVFCYYKKLFFVIIVIATLTNMMIKMKALLFEEKRKTYYRVLKNNLKVQRVNEISYVKKNPPAFMIIFLPVFFQLLLSLANLHLIQISLHLLKKADFSSHGVQVSKIIPCYFCIFPITAFFWLL